MWRYIQDGLHSLPDSPLFLSINLQRRLSRWTAGTVLRQIGERANVENVHPHRFRHPFAIMYLRNGGDVFTLQRMLGHASLEMVKRYLLLADTDTQAAHRKASVFHPFLLIQPNTKSGRRDSNPRISAWKADALPLGHARNAGILPERWGRVKERGDLVKSLAVLR